MHCMLTLNDDFDKKPKFSYLLLDFDLNLELRLGVSHTAVLHLMIGIQLTPEALPEDVHNLKGTCWPPW